MATLLEQYVQSVRERIAVEQAAIVDGSANSYDKYRERVGVAKGLQKALAILEELCKQKPKEDR